MGSSASKLTPLQSDLVHAFFRRETRYYLTGGGALAGFHLGHRTTDDIDLFTLNDEAHAGSRDVIQDVAAELGAEVELLKDAGHFRRYALSRRGEVLMIDTVREIVEQFRPDKPVIDGIRVDPPEEILANKVTTLLSRSEERDLVDVMFLERAGYRVEDVLEAARRKDGGCTPAQLAWLLSQVEIPDHVTLAAGVNGAELNAYLKDLIGRLTVLAFPRTKPKA